MARYVHGVTAVVALGLASACAPGAVKTQQNLNRSYDFSNFSSYHQGKDTRVVVLGDTFGMDAGAFADGVTAAMQGQNPGRPTNFTTAPGPSAEKNFRVVMAFNVAPIHYDLCNGAKVTPRTAGGETTLQAAWCWEDRTESYVRAWTAPVQPNDPRFQELVARTTRELFPQHKDRELIQDNSDDGPPT